MKMATKVWSDNYDGVYFSRAAYNELTLQMSTSDWHTHQQKTVFVHEDTPILVYNQELEDFVWDNE